MFVGLRGSILFYFYHQPLAECLTLTDAQEMSARVNKCYLWDNDHNDNYCYHLLYAYCVQYSVNSVPTNPVTLEIWCCYLCYRCGTWDIKYSAPSGYGSQVQIQFTIHTHSSTTLGLLMHVHRNPTLLHTSRDSETYVCRQQQHLPGNVTWWKKQLGATILHLCALLPDRGVITQKGGIFGQLVHWHRFIWCLFDIHSHQVIRSKRQKD
jgi:hypothetical protein